MKCGNIWLTDEIEKDEPNPQTWPRKFRWVCEPSFALDMKLFIKKITPNFAQKTIDVEVYDPVNNLVYDWIGQCSEAAKKQDFSQKITVRLFDGCGNEFKKMEFLGLQLMFHEMPLDSDSDAVTHELIFTYRQKK